jgi:hypothetical protein
MWEKEKFLKLNFTWPNDLMGDDHFCNYAALVKNYSWK